MRSMDERPLLTVQLEERIRQSKIPSDYTLTYKL